MNQDSRATALKDFPERPRLVLRVAFAGRKELTEAESANLETGLRDVLQTLGHQLAALVPGVPVASGQEPRVATYFARQRPLLRMVTGLFHGADELAARVLDTVEVLPDAGATCEPEVRCLETELAAVLPFDVETCRRSRQRGFHLEFDRQLQNCAWVLELDGKHDSSLPDTPLARNRLSRAGRAQAAFLLRHGDILIAADDPDDAGNAGGTFETVREALAFDLPVVFLHTGRTGDNIYLISPDDDVHSVLADPPAPAAEWQKRLRQWVTQVTADPDNGLNPGDGIQSDAREHGEELLREFFEDVDMPPRDAAGKRKPGRRERLWARLEKRYRRGPDVKSDEPLAPFATYRKRATDLNYHYSGQYRGAFALNYAAAVVAVALAAVSLTLLGSSSHTAAAEPIAALLQSAGHLPTDTSVPAETPIPAAVQPTAAQPGAVQADAAGQPQEKADGGSRSAPWLWPVLLVLTIVKLGIVSFISFNTNRANAKRWNDRAVDYRYLAERLRGMYYLPLAGSHQPPAAEPPQFASRVVRQSTVDWLFDAIVRAASPAELPHAAPRHYPANDEHGDLSVEKLITLQPKKTAEKVRDEWVGEQAKYHERTYRTMHALNHSIEKAAARFSVIVIVVVVIDLVLLGGKVAGCLPDAWIPFAKAATPWLIFISALLPAIVAALGGMRFQSECQRLAERSAVMRVLLAGRDDQPGGRREAVRALTQRIDQHQAAPATDPGAWSLDVLRLTERIATDCVQEAAEWSVLYTKEVSEPG